MSEYVKLTEDEARGHERLWELFAEVLSEIRRDQRGYIKTNRDETLTKLVSMAVDTCRYCGSYDGSCQCWNDD